MREFFGPICRSEPSLPTNAVGAKSKDGLAIEYESENPPRKEAKKLMAATRAESQRIMVMSLEMPDIMRILAE